jgi:hypothetical protein
MFNGPFVDILIFAVLAIFLVFRLRSILGRRDGFEEDRILKPLMPLKRNQNQTLIPVCHLAKVLTRLLPLIPVLANRHSWMARNRFMP